MQMLIQAASLISAFVILALLALRPSSPRR